MISKILGIEFAIILIATCIFILIEPWINKDVKAKRKIMLCIITIVNIVMWSCIKTIN